MKINVSGLANPGSYEFVLHAQDSSGKVKSQFKSFSVLIEQTEPEIVPPDNLEIETSGNSFFFTQGGSYMTLKSIATREGYDEIDVDNNCY
ncbi:MAG: hypothetical protein MJ223_00035 [Mycoplasmoidaceae bacterium]|nr:hypothetical protein [Mycoplasmoidaceae bacterium]